MNPDEIKKRAFEEIQTRLDTIPDGEKKRMRMSKTERFIDMLKFRGGHYEQKKK